MSSRIEDPDERLKLHSLDLSFSSDAEPLYGGAITMAYGFSYGNPGSEYWMNDGQMKETLDLNTEIRFSIIDTAKNPANVSSILIEFDEKGSPFEWSKREFPKDEKLPDRTPAGKHASPGCGVRGTGWLCGPYKAVKPGDFECTVTVWATAADGKGKMFQVDPEMVIRGG